jgi:exonuclease 3'-5' domain-containing protein 1
MPPFIASAKNSPAAAVAVATTAELKDVDDVNTHTSENVCSSSGTDTDTAVTTNSPHPATQPPCLAAHAAMLTETLNHTALLLSDCTRSPTSPMPCDYPDDFAMAANAAGSSTAATAISVKPAAPVTVTTTTTTLLGCTASSPESSSRHITLTPNNSSVKRTPAPPPPIDFCDPVKHSLNTFMPSQPSEKYRGISMMATVGDSATLSPVSAGSDMLFAGGAGVPLAGVSPISAVAEALSGVSNSNPAVAVKPLVSVSASHGSSGPFHPLERSLVGISSANSTNSVSGTNVASGVGLAVVSAGSGCSIGLEAGASPGALRNAAASSLSTPHHGYAPSSDYQPMEHHTLPCSIGFAQGEDLHGSGSAANGGGGGVAPVSSVPRLAHSFARHTPGFANTSTRSGNAYDMHWQETGTKSCYFSHFTHPLLTSIESSSGGGPLAEGGYGYTPRINGGRGAARSGGVMAHDGIGHSQDRNRTSSIGSGSGGPWTSSSFSVVGCGSGDHEGLPTYSEPHSLFFGEGPPPPVRMGINPSDHDYSDGGNVYDDAAFNENEMRFGSYVPQDVQCVEQLEDLDYICHGLLAEAAAMQRQYQRRCRERQYRAEDPFDEEELDSKLVVALDLEGRSLGRAGSICIITLATYSTVYIIDMVLLGAQALGDTSALKAVLESTSITKLMFDCRADCDALFFLYHVRLRNVCDLQISSCYALFPMARHLPGMKDVFRVLGLFADEDTDIKEAGRHLFNPESGGSFDRWEERPLPDILLQYCAVDVKYFFLAKLMLWDHLDEGFCLGEARLASVCAGNFVGCSKGNSLRDFEIL